MRHEDYINNDHTYVFPCTPSTLQYEDLSWIPVYFGQLSTSIRVQQKLSYRIIWLKRRAKIIILFYACMFAHPEDNTQHSHSLHELGFLTSSPSLLHIHDTYAEGVSSLHGSFAPLYSMSHEPEDWHQPSMHFFLRVAQHLSSTPVPFPSNHTELPILCAIS